MHALCGPFDDGLARRPLVCKRGGTRAFPAGRWNVKPFLLGAVVGPVATFAAVKLLVQPGAGLEALGAIPFALAAGVAAGGWAGGWPGAFGAVASMGGLYLFNTREGVYRESLIGAPIPVLEAE